MSGSCVNYIKNQFRRDWLLYRCEPPHFYNQRWNAFDFTYGRHRSPYPFFRGFLTSEVIRTGDKLLDIGCGDGFFTNSFYSNRCSSIDAIDIEASAIDAAKHLNCNDKISYRVLDAVHDAFPGENYDVVVWDGAIGHFAKSDLSVVLQKIAAALKSEGIFVGSESLGNEGADHLQFFDDESSLAKVFASFFKYVAARSIEYPSALIIMKVFLRREAYWRCWNNSDARHSLSTWHMFK